MSTLRTNARAFAGQVGIPAHMHEAFADDIERLTGQIVALIQQGLSATEAATEVARRRGVKVPSRRKPIR